MTDFADRLGGPKQSRLSQFETGPEGPPLEIVEKYADFFQLKGPERVDFFLAAIEASDPIRIDVSKVHPFFQDNLRKYLAVVLGSNNMGEIIQRKTADPSYGKIYLSSNSYRDQYADLERTQKRLRESFETFLKEGEKEYELLPIPKITPEKVSSPDTPQDPRKLGTPSSDDPQ
jgi:hypothetical protein